MATPLVTLDSATPADATLLSNLLELYTHDLSAAFPSVELGPDGRFGYDKLPLYWTEPDRRFAFLIRCDGRVAGFALATRGSPVVADPDVFDVAEFFVLRQYRRSGVGREAALLLWNRFPGAWTCECPGEFRRGLILVGRRGRFARGSATVSSLRRNPSAWRIFSFDICE